MTSKCKKYANCDHVDGHPWPCCATQAQVAAWQEARRKPDAMELYLIHDADLTRDLGHLQRMRERPLEVWEEELRVRANNSGLEAMMNRCKKTTSCSYPDGHEGVCGHNHPADPTGRTPEELLTYAQHDAELTQAVYRRHQEAGFPLDTYKKGTRPAWKDVFAPMEPPPIPSFTTTTLFLHLLRETYPQGGYEEVDTDPACCCGYARSEHDGYENHTYVEYGKGED